MPGSRLPTRRVASSYTEGCFSLHGGSRLPTRRIASPYTEGLGFLHGGCVGDIGLSLNCCQCCQYPIPIPNWPLATLGLATFPHWQHCSTTCGSRPLSMWSGFGIIHSMTIKHLQNGMIARMAETVPLPALRAVAMRGFVASRGAKAPGIQARAKAFLEALLWEARPRAGIHAE